MRKAFFYISFIVISCSTNIDEKIVELEHYSLSVPGEWFLVQTDGIDSKITMLITKSTDTIYLDYGQHVQGFSETIKVHSLESKVHFDSIDWPYRHEMIFSKNATVEERQGIYLDEYYRYDTIDGRQAKIMLPKVVGKGSTGIHFDSLNQKNEKFTIVGNNLDETVREKLQKVFYTVEFK